MLDQASVSDTQASLLEAKYLIIKEYRILYTKRPKEFAFELAHELSQLADMLAESGRLDEALVAIGEAAGLYQSLLRVPIIDDDKVARESIHSVSTDVGGHSTDHHHQGEIAGPSALSDALSPAPELGAPTDHTTTYHIKRQLNEDTSDVQSIEHEEQEDVLLVFFNATTSTFDFLHNFGISKSIIKLFTNFQSIAASEDMTKELSLMFQSVPKNENNQKPTSTPPRRLPPYQFRKATVAPLRGRANGGGRLRIKLDQPDFVAWSKLWGHTVSFKRLEYRKLNKGVCHEFILLRGLSKRELPSESQPPPAIPSSPSGTPIWGSDWWNSVPDEVGEYVLKFESMASQDSQLNTTVGTETHDYVELGEFTYLDSDERNSTTVLKIQFPDPVMLEEVINICSSISKHRHTQMYTLRQFNCFFFCWSIVAILVRLHVDWAPALQYKPDTTMQSITSKLVALSDPQRTRPQVTSGVRPNLALFIAGEYDRNGSPDPLQRPFVRLFHNTIKELSTFQNILGSLQNPLRQLPLWIQDDLDMVRDHVRDLLNKIADSTIDLVTEGTGELTIDALICGDKYIQGLSPDWEDLIKKEANDLLESFVNSAWKTFVAALEQTEKIDRERKHQGSVTRNRQSKSLQRVGTSPLILGTRPIPMGLRVAWNSARVCASLGQGYVGSALTKLSILKRTIGNAPNQIQNVSGIAASFLSPLRMKRGEIRADTSQSQPQPKVSLNVESSAVLGMMTDTDVQQPELGDRAVCELEKSIKNLALHRPKCTMHELRMATLEMLIRLKEIGKGSHLPLRPANLWRSCLWHSLGQEIIKVFEEAAEPGPTRRIRCWLQTPKSKTHEEEQPMLISEIHGFIYDRIQNLSETLHNRAGPGATKSCQQEIEEAMDLIWRGTLEIQAERVTYRPDRNGQGSRACVRFGIPQECSQQACDIPGHHMVLSHTA